MNSKFPRRPLLAAEGAQTSGGAASSAASGGAQAAPAAGAQNGGSAGGSAATLNVVSDASKSVSSNDWTSGFDEDLKGYVGNKGFKSPADLANAYKNAEKLIGVPQERVLKLPERFYDDAGKLTPEGRAIREKIGAPKEAKDYELTVPKEGGDPKLMEHFKSVFHELGIPKADAEKIAGSWNTYAEAQTTAAKEAQTAKFRDEQSALSKEWGAALEQNTNLAKEAVRTMGIDPKDIDAMSSAIGHAKTMKFLHKLGSQVREAPFVGGQRSNTILEPASAKNQINELKTDRNFAKLLSSGDRDAMAKWESLHRQAYPGDMNI